MGIKLFCFPYAGGSANIYKKWKNGLDHSIELCPVELRGRGSRFGEPLYRNFQEASDDLHDFLVKSMDESPFAIFGYSMGSLFALEMAKRLREQNGRNAEHLFFAARQAPHLSNDEDTSHLLPENEFKRKIMELGGTMKEVFEHEELSQIFIPIIRSDYGLNATYRPPETVPILDCDFSVLRGDTDVFGVDGLQEWGKYTKGNCSVHTFLGNHFFINNQESEIISLINKTLLKNL